MNIREFIRKNLYLGMRLEVSSATGELVFIGLLDDIEEETIKITGHSRKNLPPIIYNTSVHLKGFADGLRPIVIQAQVCGSTQTSWWVNQLQVLNFSENRSNFRQRVDIQSKAARVNAMFHPSEDTSTDKLESDPCQIVNISVNGILIRSAQSYQVGDWLLLLDVDIVPQVRKFSFTCRIVRRDETTRGTLYGCEFSGLDPCDQDMLLRAIFITQRSEILEQKKWDR